MATLTSPGVDISVIDESFRSSAGEGTIPLIVIATDSDKVAPGTQADDTVGSIAPGTTAANAEKLYLITSQRELVQTFGDPIFKSSQGTPLHGNELNEYGLLAAYSYLGIANRAYVIRADVPLGELSPTSSEPTSEPTNGTYWFDTSSTVWGIFTSNGGGNSVEFLDWDEGTVNVIDTTAESEKRLIGNLGGASAVTDASAAGLVTPAGTLSINSTTISISDNASLNDVVTAINDASISGISASIWYTDKGLNIKIKHNTGDTIDLTGSTSTVLVDLGLDSAPSTTAQLDHPNQSVGSTGEFAVVTLDTQNRYYEKIVAKDADGVAITGASAEWYHVGTDSWREAVPTLVVGDTASPSFAGSETFNMALTFADGASSSLNILTLASETVTELKDRLLLETAVSTYVATGQLAVSVDGNGYLRIENLDGGTVDVTGTAATILGLTSVFARQLNYASHTAIPKQSRAGDAWIKTSTPNNGADFIVKLYDTATGQFSIVDAPFYADDATATAAIGTPATGGLYVEYDLSDVDTATQTIKRWTGSAWAALTYTASATSPTNEATEGTMWYNESFQVDIMVGNGSQWLGMNNHNLYTSSEIILSASEPTVKPSTSPISAGGALVDNDIWIDTSDTENYPLIYKYSTTTKSFTLVDNTDQTTPFGIVFADARWHDGSASQLQTQAAFNASNFVDPDAPDPLLYPNGTLLFNTRYSTLNVKEWKPTQLSSYTSNGLLAQGITTDQYTVGTATYSALDDDDVGRWVTVSGNRTDGAMWAGRKAQRAVVVTAMQSVLASDQTMRNETVFFNLIACPGYTEVIDEMVTLNVDKKQQAFVVGDTPARLTPDGTSIQNWATNAAEAPSNGDEGLTTGDTYTGLYYPWGLSTNLDGTEVMVPPSHMALRTIAFNDSVAFQWFAPAGFNRGVVSNATTVGYLTSEDEFKVTVLNQGQRDTLYLNKINPISYMPGQGLVVFGQKTLHATDSALDRINVVRLVNYLRRQFEDLSQPYLFEPNDQQTRDSVKSTFERALTELITLRAIDDFVVQCDTDNNTPERIDRNELWVDVAIIPIKAIEFIYVPIRILNTGEI